MMERLAVGAGIAYGGYKIGSGIGSGVKAGAESAKATMDGGIKTVCEGIEAGGKAAGTAVVETAGSVLKLSAVKFAVISFITMAVVYRCRYVQKHVYFCFALFQPCHELYTGLVYPTGN